ncbi:MAG: GNAT family N-acetyltransferase [Shewanella sp.]
MKLIWLDEQNRRYAYGFYHSFMPYAHISRKEKIAVLIKNGRQNNPINTEQIFASLRLRAVGEFNILLGILVHPEHRGRGLGHQLMNGVADKLISDKIYLFSLPYLVEFYQHHGFSQEVLAPNDIVQLFEKYTSKGKKLVLMGYVPAPLQSEGFRAS